MLSSLARPIPAPGFPGWARDVQPRSATWSWLASRYFTLTVLTLALPFICLAGRPLFGDVWWVMASGRLLVERGSIPQSEPFTFAPHVDQYFDVQWLAQLAYYLPYHFFGLEGVAVFNAAAVTLTFALLLRIAWERSRNMAAATLSVLFAELTALWFLHPRAQTLAFATFAATYWLLSRRWAGLREVVALAAVQAVWSNLHGSFFMGPALTAMLLTAEVAEAVLAASWRGALSGRRVRFLCLALGAQLLGTLATPYGPGIYTYLLKFSVDPIIREHISEWLPTTAGDWPGAEFFASAVLAVAVIARARTRVAVADVLMLGLFGVLGVQAYRNIPWWGLAASPILAYYLAHLSMPRLLARVGGYLVTTTPRVRGNAIRGLLLALVLIGALPWARAANPSLPDSQRSMIAAEYPEAATNFLAAQPYGGRLFSEHPWGAYIDWWLWPRYQPMIDPSIEVHPTDVWLDILTLNQGHASWEELADRYAVDVMMLRLETQRLLIEAVERSPRWKAVYRDQQAVIYVRAAQQEQPV
ncbi:MAG: hypothetical protein M3336_13315 [Chloroflexota bacterium]|nr:hypothetical protein [Chloroflexota bacterium]